MRNAKVENVETKTQPLKKTSTFLLFTMHSLPCVAYIYLRASKKLVKNQITQIIQVKSKQIADFPLPKGLFWSPPKCRYLQCQRGSFLRLFSRLMQRIQSLVNSGVSNFNNQAPSPQKPKQLESLKNLPHRTITNDFCGICVLCAVP